MTVDASVSARARHRTTIKWSYAYKRDDGLLVDRDAMNDDDELKKDRRQDSAAATGEARKHENSTKGDRNCASSHAEGLASVSCRVESIYQDARVSIVESILRASDRSSKGK